MSCNCPKMSSANFEMEQEQEFAEEPARITSFSNFPSTCPISAPALARAGFYYTGIEDRVKCFSCQGIVEGWQHGDTAIGKHRKISPNCKFINGFNVTSDCIQTQVPVIPNSNPHIDGNCSQDVANNVMHVSSSAYHSDFLLRTGRVVDESKAKYPKYPDMCDEENRLKTFHNWPNYVRITPKELAAAGLFYSGINDQVKCFCCGGKLMNWEPSDKAWTEHKRHFPECFFVLGRDVGNVTHESSGTSNSSRQGSEITDNPGMNQYKARLDSFAQWVFSTNKEALAKAGFYSIGESDVTKCFCCGGLLKDWKLKEDPWEEHAKWYPGCKFLIEKKGQHFINTIQLMRPLEKKMAACAENIPSLPADSELMKNPLVTGAQKMGFNFEDIKMAMRKKLEATREMYTSIEILVSDLLNAQTEIEDEKPKEKESSIEEKLRQLEEEKICKLCMDKGISIVFIPCGHLVACVECAEQVDRCPICCMVIQRRQRIFMS
ncbi:E3 ubiquitin- ligase XIAP [Pelobates cultripes]|uniref:E3 ubiquitin-protein ligase XIAP n=1 Tax=Pelobates cultripes TaxID=61616 RepID=A0AAD1T5C2_PELCU|nr:E3 ubiquitin- ligase XIAP [Pelobates cultripes]